MESQVEEDGTAQIPPFFMSGLFLLFLDIYIYKKTAALLCFFSLGGAEQRKKRRTLTKMTQLSGKVRPCDACINSFPSYKI